MRHSFDTSSIGNVLRTPTFGLRVAPQGGGALGAYAVGVLEIIDADPDIYITDMGGPSAAAVTSGTYAAAGMEGVHHTWGEIAQAGQAAHIISMLDPYKVLETINSSYIMNSWRASGACPDTGPRLYMRSLLKEVIGSDEALQNADIDLYISTVTKIDPRGGLERDNVQEHIFTGENLSIDSILASGALEELGPVKIGKDLHWDGVYSGNNPNLGMFDHKPTAPTLVITVDRPEILQCSRDPNIIYGPIHGEILEARRQSSAPLFKLGLQQPAHWSDNVRTNPIPSTIATLREMGQEDAMAALPTIKREIARYTASNDLDNELTAKVG